MSSFPAFNIIFIYAPLEVMVVEVYFLIRFLLSLISPGSPGSLSLQIRVHFRSCTAFMLSHFRIALNEMYSLSFPFLQVQLFASCICNYNNHPNYLPKNSH